MNTASYSVDDLLRIMQRLRDPQTGCPWDIKQSFESIVPSTLEECYELAAAIEAGDFKHLPDELGDVLFQVVFYAQLGSERDLFDFGSVVHGLCEKLLRRHPHVFGDGDIDTVVDTRVDSDQVKGRWEAIKAEERAQRAQHGALDDVPVALPALPRAQKLQKRAARVGFDWSDSQPVFDKMAEEIEELQQAVSDGSQQRVEEELGDLIFTAVNLARHLKVDAERALRLSNRKFEQRFRSLEATAAARGQAVDTLSMPELDALWEAVKQAETDPPA